MQQNNQWPPNYSVRRSRRARRVRLHICRAKGLQVVIPQRYSARKVPQIVQKHKTWIERTLERYKPASDIHFLPQEFHLIAIDELWTLHYRPTDAKSVKLTVVRERELLLAGNISDENAVIKVLRLWLRKYAHQHLLPWLAIISQRVELPYATAAISHAKTRWGSCSARKRISLNAKLLFLSPDLVEHIIVHELCHTIHLNHSRLFWDLFSRIHSDCFQVQKKLRQAHFDLPLWVDS